MFRNKFGGSVPGTKKDIQLDGSDLISNADSNMKDLESDLKEILEKLTTKNQLQKSVEEMKAQREIQSAVPTYIYTGTAQ